jgi:hypothetical protein
MFVISIILVTLSTSVYSQQELIHEKVDIVPLEAEIAKSSLEKDPGNLWFAVSCHKRLQRIIESDISKNFDDLYSVPKELCSTEEVQTGFLNEIGATQLVEYRFRELNPYYYNFLKTCHENEMNHHQEMMALSAKAYDISFQDRNKPKIIGKLPNEYVVQRFFGHQPNECHQTGFKAAMVKKGNETVFMITGTEADEKYSNGSNREYINGKTSKQVDEDDWNLVNINTPVGYKQFAPQCAIAIFKAAREQFENGQKISFTGHSMGGGLSQALALVVQDNLNKLHPEKKPVVRSVSFMAAGGDHLSQQYGYVKNRDQALESLESTVYISQGDIVSNWGKQIGSIRLLRKVDINPQGESKKDFSAHSLILDNFMPTSESYRYPGQEFLKHYEDNNK